MEVLKQNVKAEEAIVILFVKVAAKPASQQKAKEALLADVNGARTEAGNLKMELYKADDDPDNFYLFERWQSQKALDNHFKQTYTQGAFELQKADVAMPIEMNYLEELWPLPTKFQKEEHRSLTTLIVPFEIKPECSDAFIAYFKEFVPQVRKESGNVEFHFHRVIKSDTRFVLYERWESLQDLDAHNRLPSTTTLIVNIRPLLTRAVADYVLFAKDIS